MIGEMINRFDKTMGTVKEFNEIFTDCPLKDYPENAEVEICELVCGVRKLLINNTEIYHQLMKFYERN